MIYDTNHKHPKCGRKFELLENAGVVSLYCAECDSELMLGKLEITFVRKALDAVAKYLVAQKEAKRRERLDRGIKRDLDWMVSFLKDQNFPPDDLKHLTDLVAKL